MYNAAGWRNLAVFESHVVIHGAGAPVVLIHGVGLDHAMWNPLATRIEDRFQVLRYDLIGHGRTAPRGERIGFEDLTAQLVEVLEESGLRSVHLVGFSLGALVAQAFTLDHGDRVRRLALLNSAFERTAAQQAAIRSRLRQVERHGVAANVDASIERWFSDGFRQRHPEQIRLVENRLRSNDAGGFLPAYRLFAESGSRFKDRLNQIRKPTLVITGEHDTGSTPAMSRAIAREIDGAELHVFPAVKHMLPVENADKLAVILTRFLEED